MAEQLALQEPDVLAVGPRSPVPQAAVRLLIALVLLLSLARYLHGAGQLLAESRFIDFAHYYTYAAVISRGQNPFDPEAVAQVDAEFGLRRALAPPNYPPLFYLLMQPWVLLPFRAAAVGWFLVGQTCLLASLILILRRFPTVSPVRGAAALFVVLNYWPLTEHFALGQVNLVLLFLATLAWWALRNRRPWVAGAAVAIASHTKPQYALLIPLLWWMGERPTGARALFLAGLGLVAGLLFLGPAQHLAFLEHLASNPAYLYDWTANLSLRATSYRLLAGLPRAPALANGLTLALALALVAVFGRAIPRSVPSDSPSLDWSWGLGVTAVLLLSPLMSEHHLVLLLFPLCLLLLNVPLLPPPWWDQVLLVTSVVLLASRYSLERFPDFHAGALSLFTTGKLLGVAVLAWLLVRRLKPLGGAES